MDLQRRLRAAIASVGQSGGTETEEAKTVLRAVATTTFQRAYSHQLRTDVARRVRMDSDYQSPAMSARFPSARQWLDDASSANHANATSGNGGGARPGSDEPQKK